MSRRGRHPVNRLTDRVVRQALPGRHADGHRLYLVVGRNGKKRWIQRLTIHGQRTDLGLGSYPVVSLADARSRALENLVTLSAGGDPRVKATAADGSISPVVREIFETVIENRRTGWKSPATEISWRRDFEKWVFPVIGDMPVADVALGHVQRIIRPHWNGRNSKGSVLRQNLEAVFDWAIAANCRVDNPAAALKRLLPKRRSCVRHQPSLQYSEAPEALADWQGLDIQEPVRLAVLFIVLTASRLREATDARWHEIDFTKPRWTVPAARMKAGKAHSVPLSMQALDVLERARALKGDGLLFPVPERSDRFRSISQGMVSYALRKLGRVDIDGRPIVVHGFRSTFRQWSIEVAHTQREVGEAALAHGESDATVAAYTRGAEPVDLRAALMQRWADYLLPMG